MSCLPPNPVFVAHPLCPPHLRGLVEETVQAVDNPWLLPHAEGEVFKSGMALLARLQSNALHKGLGIGIITSNAKRFDWVCIQSWRVRLACDSDAYSYPIAECIDENLWTRAHTIYYAST